MKIQQLFTSIGLIAVIVLNTVFDAKAEDIENDFQTRTELKLNFKPAKKFNINLTPELRFNDNLQFDQYLLEGEITYKASKIISVGTSYRINGNKNKDSEIEYSNRFALFAEADKKSDRFTPSFRLSYTNSADDDEETNSQYFRYKTAVDYDIKNCKFSPKIGIEAFHDLTESNFHKMRYTAGLNYKLSKNNSVGISYKLDYYLHENRNRHILNIGYKLKF